MNFPSKIRLAQSYAHISEAELIRRFGLSTSAFANRKKMGRYSVDELEKIAECVGAKFEYHFVFPDGEKI